MKRKIVYLIGIVLIIIIFLFCYNKTPDTTVCSITNNQTKYNIKTKYTINSKKNIVESIIIRQTISSSDKNVLKDFERQLKEHNMSFTEFYRVMQKYNSLNYTDRINYEKENGLYKGRL